MTFYFRVPVIEQNDCRECGRKITFLDGIIAVVGDGSRCSLCQLFVIKHLFIWCKIAVQADQFREAGSDLIPIHLNIRTIALFQYDAFAAVFFKAAAFPGYSMGASASTVFLFQEISALFGRVLCLEKRIDAALSTLEAAPICKRICNFILRNEFPGFRECCHVGMVFFAWHGQFFQLGKKYLRPVVVETQQFPVFTVGVNKRPGFRQKYFSKCGICQFIRQAFCFLRVIGAANIT